ncbi:hypothetical protein GPECTOR_81g214 [Gonium pectorale]|uniref:Rieske domain-containing protein n=1 Tax=Gonium pectorale TaxID=33097 RepID=A0A150G1R9_GONPE|nr:hypothetical protein GPECTOR_81g214 [Gonium pectorale]|eukprot:KXZ43764.1 hypothetical protein GPECTOR_81g214 [Gonium pectorale]
MAMMTSRRAATQLKAPTTRRERVALVVRATVSLTSGVPDVDKRNTMNLILAAGAGLPVTTLALGYGYSFVPPSAKGVSGGQAAKDALGNDIRIGDWLKTHLPGDRSLSQGLKGDPTYLIVTADGSLEKYGLNAVCTHLGCVVPWVAYNNEGKVVRGPAPLSLALAHVSVEEGGTVTFSTWGETDFRTDMEPWWA